ncbi:plasmid mobilization protein [Flavobacterium suzhouense]|uniref:Plasmid mobilization relaxosome protein MobC n=1 Tax=Flavobacterium suzhouense TaxID=1529638 RepID=A0ABW5NUL1_9FLAO
MQKKAKSKKTRIKWLHLRLTESEHRLLASRRKGTQCRNLSEYLRSVIFNLPVTATYRNLTQDSLLQQMVVTNRELNAIGKNLNQITKKLHLLSPEKVPDWYKNFEPLLQILVHKINETKENLILISTKWLR